MFVTVIIGNAIAGYSTYIYMKDIIFYADDHLKRIDLSANVGAIPIIYNFEVKKENDLRTIFISGTINKLKTTTFGSRASFIHKMSVDIPSFSCIG